MKNFSLVTLLSTVQDLFKTSHTPYTVTFMVNPNATKFMSVSRKDGYYAGPDISLQFKNLNLELSPFYIFSSQWITTYFLVRFSALYKCLGPGLAVTSADLHVQMFRPPSRSLSVCQMDSNPQQPVHKLLLSCSTTPSRWDKSRKEESLLVVRLQFFTHLNYRALAL